MGIIYGECSNAHAEDRGAGRGARGALREQGGGGEQDFGLSLRDITPETRKGLGIEDRTGVAVVDVDRESAGDEAGIEAGDVVKEVNRQHVGNLAAYRAAVAKEQKDAPVLLLVKRGRTTF